jgi:hypothetical protein
MARHRAIWATVMVAVVMVAGACGGSPKRPAALATTTTTVATTTTKPPVRAAVAPVCPLNGMPPPGGRVPPRPALAVKIDNFPSARPQTGLSKADVLYEEPVEGGLTRFIAIYQCHDAPLVEPVRSGRLIDPEILSQYGAHPLIAYSGAIQPAVAAIDSSQLIDVGANRAPLSAFWRDPNRAAPHNLATSTAALYAFGASLHAPAVAPPSPFVFGPLDPTAGPAASVHIAFTVSSVTWTWVQSAGAWFRSNSDTGAATVGEGGPLKTNNVIVMHVVLFPSQYVEDPTGAHENLLVLTGTGPLQVFRNGTMVNGTWSRPSLAANTSYLDGAGHLIALSPGQTWIELVPTTVAVTATP